MYVEALTGGLMIGLAAAGLLLLRGQVAGISSAFGNLVLGKAGDGAWRAAFVAGLLAAIPAWFLGTGALPPMQLALGPAGAVAAGLLVGFGTALSAGCTSGHGVCGLANLSRRSLTATLTFMGVAAGTVYVTRHLVGA